MAPLDSTHQVGRDSTGSNNASNPLLNEVQGARAGSGSASTNVDYRSMAGTAGESGSFSNFAPGIAPPVFKFNPPPVPGSPGAGSFDRNFSLPDASQPPPNPGGGDTKGSTADSLGREAVVLGGGVGKAFVYGLANLPEKLPQIGTSIAIGAGLSAIAKSGQLGLDAAFVVGAYFGCRFVLNTIHDTARWQKFGSAVSDAWNSNQHVMKDLNDVADSGGDFAFNTSLSMASGYVGYKDKALGDLIISILRIPAAVPAEVASSALLVPSMYLDIIPPMYFKRDENDGKDGHDTKWSFDVNLRGTVDKSTSPHNNDNGKDNQDPNKGKAAGDAGGSH
ncbi:MAG TPA: hypothetical protein V6C72_15230 [Chroococcales cyanobacterium]